MKRDEQTFISLYEKVYKELYRYALCIMRNPHDAEDCVSEAVLKAYEKMASLRAEEAFKSWIFTILANVCKKKLKDMSKRGEETMEGREEVGSSVNYDLPLDLQKAFMVLSNQERQIIGLSVYGGYNSTEIAAILKLNQNTVRSKRSRAYARLRLFLE
ncbi:RNA polymerase sigma factor (sigma-70 family) [Lachnospiraceae bacterium PF1-21]|uniref:RNA polymerase sigma factor n=1 Tax=Ohessyouella blattaphilus TaxID=2949333 RepID=A0ABT1EHR2_9FIRM|nr:RNA polymerase sigma factor [Ohessyouella blattaphilus]MCP1110046.1 RNA polymerase sigma factor [Ohessyouella blattaphilus]MCR8563440.1 RNA polymerase sigma factor [Ohessyouella blattaphilus]MDL2249182.1 RNA polymerase sigma factor [Lachnospiraceae bacterium OttesenSCG-928-J05]